MRIQFISIFSLVFNTLSARFALFIREFTGLDSDNRRSSNPGTLLIFLQFSFEL
ncbi:hypothetical protein HanRHA438_Chr09g0394201 [Helianthus annuus]|nr:hypothetical protein HanRHA438_Chr09g0394201 [Helianthus annuus]